MKRSNFPLFRLTLCFLVPTVGSYLQAESILSTNFSGRTISGTTASDITWMTNGLEDPGSMTAINEGSGSISGLFTTPDAAGVFAVSKNIETVGPWSTEISLTLTVDQLILDSLELGINNFNNSGERQDGVTRQSEWTASVTGSSSGLIDSQSAITSFFEFGPDYITIEFSSGLVLTDAETYTLNISVQDTGSALGNNVGITSLNLTAVPEPAHSAIALAMFVGVGAALRRRRNR